LRAKADRDRILQALGNLISNALRHARGCPEIILSAALHGDLIRVSVMDSGPGIPTDALPHIFDRYWQAHPRRAGAGLGLAIAKGIVNSHGGTISAQNRNGSGAVFSFTLPVAQS
jgi:signal transduction histidine kinase